MNKNNTHNIIITLFYGILMGTANKIPGVSGGLVALVLNFYKKLVNSIENIYINKLFKFKFKKAFEKSDILFLSLISLGIIISYFSTSKILDFFLTKHEVYVWSLFFGLVIGTIVHLGKKLDKKNSIKMIIIGLSFGVIISFIEPLNENRNLFYIFICGILSICGMIIPGLSGSFLLIILGNYFLLLVDCVNTLFDSIFNSLNGDFSFMNDPIIIDKLVIIVVFTLGSISGLILLSKLMASLLKNHNKIIESLIFGFISGSLGVLWPWKNINSTTQSIQRYLPEFNNELMIAIFLILLGIFTISVLSYYEKSEKN